jgi:glycosyltransferase involved in cell wall biosynthesis
LERNQSRDRIHFVGADKNAAAALALADGLILTSLFEAWPTVILEAFAARVPVFSYDCPSGPREMLGDGARGVLTDENPEALATAIVKFFRTSADYRESLIENGQEFLKGFMPETAMALWERELAEIWESIHVPRGD